MLRGGCWCYGSGCSWCVPSGAVRGLAGEPVKRRELTLPLVRRPGVKRRVALVVIDLQTAVCPSRRAPASQSFGSMSPTPLRAPSFKRCSNLFRSARWSLPVLNPSIASPPPVAAPRSSPTRSSWRRTGTARGRARLRRHRKSSRNRTRHWVRGSSTCEPLRAWWPSFAIRARDRGVSTWRSP